MAGPESEWLKIKRVSIGFLYDYFPVRTLADFFRSEWQGLKAGRALLILACLVCVAGGLWGGCQIERYRSVKASLAVPGVAPRRESAREWPALTETQIQEWVEALKSHPHVMILVIFPPDVEAVEFFRSLKTVGKKSGWEVYHGGGNADPSASEIDVSTTLDHKATAQIIVQLLNRMNYPAKLRTEAGAGGAVTITIPEKMN